MAKQLEELLPGKFAEMESDREIALSEEQRSALQVPPLDRTEQEQQLVADAQRKMKVTWRIVAQNTAPETRAKAKRLAEEYVEATETNSLVPTKTKALNTKCKV